MIGQVASRLRSGTVALYVPKWLKRMAVITGLVLVLLAGLDLRTRGMYPVDQALLYQADYDEGVHIAGAQLMLQGYVPYRDFLFLQPPFALFLFAGIAKLHWTPWGDATTFALARYAAIAFSGLALLGAFVATRKLGGVFAGFVAAGLLAVDAVAVETDRRAMLEPFANALSIFAVYCYLEALSRERARVRWLIAAGVVGALAALTKTTAALCLIACLAYATLLAAGAGIGWIARRREPKTGQLLRSRIADLAILACSALVTGLLVAGYFILTNSTRFFQQVYLFHMVRPMDGTIEMGQRLNDVLGYTGAHLTVYVALAGVLFVIARGVLQQDWGHWGVVVIWAALMTALFATSRTFFPHYYVQLALPLAVLAGAVAGHATVEPGSLVPRWWERGRMATGRIVQVGTLAWLLFTVVAYGPGQYAQAQNVAKLRSPNLADVSRYLANQTPAGASVLGFQPIYAVAGSRPPAGWDACNLLVDSYGFILYTNAGMQDELMPQVSDESIWDAVHGADGQARILELAPQADYVIVDRQARWELNPDVLDAILAGRRQVFESGKVTVHARP